MKIISKVLILLLCALQIFTWRVPSSIAAGGAPKIVRDTEIEETLKAWLAPLLEAAHMPANSVNIILVEDTQINAFVAGGPNIFIYTGLIDRTENPGELIGVMAHELGHIAGGHLIATRKALEHASYESILGAVLGIGAAILGGGDAAGAIIGTSQGFAQRSFFAHSRTQESSADQAAIRFMDGAQINPEGLSTFFDKLAANELVSTDQQSEYVRTHPLTVNRIDAVENNVKDSPFYQKDINPEWIEQHKRMKAKLTGFINPGRVPWIYDPNDQSIDALYARAIAAYRLSQIDEAVALVDQLIAREPKNPYFYELKGQMLIDFAKIKDAIAPLEHAVELRPQSGLIRIMLGHAYIEDQQYESAIKALERALHNEPKSATARLFLTQAYARLGDEDMVQINLAERFLLLGQTAKAREIVTRTLNRANKEGRAYRMANDIKLYLDRNAPETE